MSRLIQISLLSIAITLSFASPLLISLYFLPSWEARGQFGDSFGAVSAMFSGVAFIFLLATIWQQQDEISQSRKEHSDTEANSKILINLEVASLLISFYSKEIDRLQETIGDGPAGAANSAQLEIYIAKLGALENAIDQAHDRVLRGLGAQDVR